MYNLYTDRDEHLGSYTAEELVRVLINHRIVLRNGAGYLFIEEDA